MSTTSLEPGASGRFDRGTWAAGPVAAVLILALRGEIGYLSYAPASLALLAWGLAVGITGGLLSRRIPDREGTDLARVRAVWFLPLAGLVSLSALLTALLGAPGALGVTDAWPRWLGLAPEDVAPLVLAAYTMPVGLALRLAGLAVARLFARGLAARNPVRDRLAGRLALALGLVAAGLVLAVAKAPSTRMGLLRAWLQVRTGDAESGLVQLERLLAEAPGDRLADSIRYRMARLWQVELATPREARRAFTRLLETHPDSAWADDALLHLAEVCHEEGDPARALAWVESLPQRFPGSSLVGPAALLAARIHRQEGRPEVATRLLEGLLSARGAVRRGDRYPWILVPVPTLAREELARMAPGSRAP